MRLSSLLSIGSSVSTLGRESGQNREAIYRDARCVQEQLADGSAREQQLRDENQRLREEFQTRQQAAAYNPFTDPAKVDQYAATAQAEGVSLPVAQRLLRILQANRHLP
ncbi:MAG: hypothetical protein ACKV2Q_23325 [Planctomycetaceae bacterium]